MRGKLILSAGGIEIDCVMNKERIPEAVECFDKRVIVEGTAHYDGENQIPARLDVANIKVVGRPKPLLRWRGAFARDQSDADESDW
ncbi:MAG: hypothetical protein JOY83_18305 [Alphaproteobacteria bacterium]|nr:hypothetical protein [Alphaproteobacteria bacterium]